MKKSKVIKNLNPLFLKGIAHRGLHNEKFTENGLLAFKNAIDNNCAFELDVHISKDNQLIVCHDDDLLRTTGKAGIIEELTVEQIKSNYKLLDGSEVPTFKEVLELTKEVVPIVVELKVRKRNYRALSKQLKKELKDVKDYKNFFLISFDPRALNGMKGTPFMQGLLVGKSHHWVYRLRHFHQSLDTEFTMVEEKSLRRYSKKHFLNVWTVETKEQFDMVYPYVDTVTFQHMDLNYVREKLTEKNFK